MQHGVRKRSKLTSPLDQVYRPSVIQIRGEDVSPQAMGNVLLKALKQFEGQLLEGALISIDAARARVRVLPL